MALWLVRAGRHGEFEQKFLEEGKVYLTWNNLNHDLGKMDSKSTLREVLSETYPTHSKGKLTNHLGQIWAFSHRIQQGDWIVLPSKHKAAIHIGESTGTYTFHGNADNPFFHSIQVKWIDTDIPRSNFDQDILYSFGAFMTVCEVKRNDAESRVRAMKQKGWKSVGVPKVVISESDEIDLVDTSDTQADIEEVARDQIAKCILAKFKGHGMAWLVDAVLRAQGYATHLSPAGPDKGIDILAAIGPLGFGHPRICVQVKSGESPLDRQTLDQLIGVMQNVHADQGLLVSWGGFKTSIYREKANQFFRVRLWDQNDLIDQILSNYEKLNDELRADLPLKRIWTLAESSPDT